MSIENTTDRKQMLTRQSIANDVGLFGRFLVRYHSTMCNNIPSRNNYSSIFSNISQFMRKHVNGIITIKLLLEKVYLIYLGSSLPGYLGI